MKQFFFQSTIIFKIKISLLQFIVGFFSLYWKLNINKIKYIKVKKT